MLLDCALQGDTLPAAATSTLQPQEMNNPSRNVQGPSCLLHVVCGISLSGRTPLLQTNGMGIFRVKK